MRLRWRAPDEVPRRKAIRRHRCRGQAVAGNRHAVEADHAGPLQIGTINSQFKEAGGSYAEYGAAVKAAIERRYLTVHPSGSYLSFTQSGADLFA